MQQSHARKVGVHEILNPTDLVEDALRLQEASFMRHQVKLRREFASPRPSPWIATKRCKSPVNLLQNAGRACEENTAVTGDLVIRASGRRDGSVRRGGG